MRSEHRRRCHRRGRRCELEPQRSAPWLGSRTDVCSKPLQELLIQTAPALVQGTLDVTPLFVVRPRKDSVESLPDVACRKLSEDAVVAGSTNQVRKARPRPCPGQER